jgi:hypothetical protein
LYGVGVVGVDVGVDIGGCGVAVLACSALNKNDWRKVVSCCLALCYAMLHVMLIAYRRSMRGRSKKCALSS